MEVALQVPVVGLPWKEFALLVVTALAGGAFGAAIGALPAFIFTGFLVFLGEGVAILQRGLADTVGALPPVSTQNAAVPITAPTEPMRVMWWVTGIFSTPRFRNSRLIAERSEERRVGKEC